MSKQYVIKPNESVWTSRQFNVNVSSITIHEDVILHDIGVLDANGNKIMAKEKPNEIGYLAARKRSG